MSHDMPSEARSLRDTAIRLIRCVGVKAALDYCRNNHWQGLCEQIELLSTHHTKH
jgi:hypothetical protein